MKHLSVECDQLNRKDLRPLPLVERKVALRKLLTRRKRSRILYLDHVQGDGRLLFEQIVAMDLEGIVCKRKDSPYKVTEKPSRYWIKIKNSRYSQLEGREENSLSALSRSMPVRGRIAPRNLPLQANLEVRNFRRSEFTSTGSRFYVERRDKPACCRG
jgi:ATP dependent DNA ligase-like protein